MKHNYTKEQLIERIEAIDATLLETRMLFEEYEGKEIPEESMDNWTRLEQNTLTLMIVRHEYQQVLAERYGIIIMNEWES